MEFVSHIMALASSTSDASHTSTSLAQNPAAKLDISPLMRLPSKYQAGVPSVSGRSSECDPDSIAGGNYHGSAESDSISSNDRCSMLEASSSAFDVMQRVEIHSPSLLRRSSGDKTTEQMLLKGVVHRESGNERTDSNQGWERRVQAWDGNRDDIEDRQEGVQFRRNDEIQKKTGDDIRNIRRDEIEGRSKDGREDNRIQAKPSGTKDELQVESSKEPPPPPPWHWMFRQRLSEPQSLKLHRSPINALVLSDENASESLTMYSVGQDGFVKVYSISEGFQVRATKLGNLPLSCLTIAHSTDAYPTVLAGSYDDFVYAYSVDYGRALGKMRVHDETVSCVQMTGNGGQRMVTASWDATVKLWGIAEGRGGWSASCAGKQVIVGSFD
jgi:WD40 repeat protein